MLDKITLADASPELQQQFLKLVQEQKNAEELQKTHRCWFFVPSLTEYERMKKFAEAPDYDKCPKCGKGRIIIEIFRGNICDSWHAVCRFGGDKGCDFKEYLSDDL